MRSRTDVQVGDGRSVGVERRTSAQVPATDQSVADAFATGDDRRADQHGDDHRARCRSGPPSATPDHDPASSMPSADRLPNARGRVGGLGVEQLAASPAPSPATMRAPAPTPISGDRRAVDDHLDDQNLRPIEPV